MYRYKDFKTTLENAEEDCLQRPETIQTTQLSTKKITKKQKQAEKQLYDPFKRQTSKKKNLDMAKKGKP